MILRPPPMHYNSLPYGWIDLCISDSERKCLLGISFQAGSLLFHPWRNQSEWECDQGTQPRRPRADGAQYVTVVTAQRSLFVARPATAPIKAFIVDRFTIFLFLDLHSGTKRSLGVHKMS